MYIYIYIYIFIYIYLNLFIYIYIYIYIYILYIQGKIREPLNARQHGFRSKHSTVTQRVLFLHEL